MPPVLISPAAEREAILEWTDHHFGPRLRIRYEALLVQAIADVAVDPHRSGSVAREEISADARTYHLLNSRNRVRSNHGRIRHPRHFLLYRERSGKGVEVGRVLHDSMDLYLHLPDRYGTGRIEEGEPEP